MKRYFAAIISAVAAAALCLAGALVPGLAAAAQAAELAVENKVYRRIEGVNARGPNLAVLSTQSLELTVSIDVPSGRFAYLGFNNSARGAGAPAAGATAGIGLAAGGHMYVVAGAATVLTLFGLEVLTLFFGGLGRRRTMIVFSAQKKEFIDAMFARLESKDYSVISYEVEAQRTSDGVVHRATIVIRAKGQASEEGYIDLLRENPDITVERVV